MVTKFFIDFINLILTILGGVVQAIFTVLPKSPFTYLNASQYTDFISKINYIIPVYEIVAIIELWLVSIGVFYIYSVYARWIKAIE